MKSPLFLAAVFAASLGAAPITLQQAVDQSLTRYPSIKVSLEQVSAAAAGVQLARTSFLPRADFLSQVNRATRNNVFGLLMPQSTLPSISGPPLADNSMTSVWGTALGLLVAWEPFDFGLRKANVATAEVARKRAEAGVERTKFEVSFAAADAFLTILAAQQMVEIAKASVVRGKSMETVVGALVKAELRPGADLERTLAEIALAETQVIQAEQAVAVGKAALAQLLGVNPSEIAPEVGKLLSMPVGLEVAGGVSEHPAAREQRVAIEEAKSRQAALDRLWYPKFLVQGATYARGTGAFANGTTGGAASGLGPNISNWGLGFIMTFPLLENPSLRAKRDVEAYKERGEEARLSLMVRELEGQMEKSKAMLDGAQKAARQAPVQLRAAKAVEQQATARYKAGLATIIEVAEAQRLLSQSEVENSIARLSVWRALLAVAGSKGDLAEFLEKAR
ncbi:MAG: TolC family protein [Candidatus Solibacter usitatus]|nr:TolC family protein [Candidatus Solibacter usitatus]